jgi:hypothetical protein
MLRRSLLAIALASWIAGCGKAGQNAGRDASSQDMAPAEQRGADSAAPTPDTATPTPDTATPTPDTATPTPDSQPASDGGTGATPDGSDADPTPAAEICPSLTAGALTDVIATARIGRDIVQLRRNGERTTVASFDDGPLSGGLLPGQGFLLADAGWSVADGSAMPDAVHQVIAVDRAGVERWRLRRQYSGWDYPAAVRADGRGGATIGIINGDTNAVRGIAVLPDGTTYDVDAFPLEHADAEGWVPVARGNDPLRPAWGFVRVATREQRPLTLALARSDLPPVVKDGRLLYLGVEAGQAAAVIEKPGAVTRLALGAVGLAGLGTTATERGVAFTVNGRPRWIALAESDQIVEAGPYPDDIADGLSLLAKGDWGLVWGYAKPFWIVNLRSGLVRRAPVLPEVGYIGIAGKWAFGMGGGYAIWRLDLESGESILLDYTLAAPFRRFDPSGCVPPITPAPLPDGWLPVPMRDDQVGGVFVGEPNVGPWRQIGRPVSGIDLVTGEPMGGTWIVRATFNTRLSCKTPWEPIAAGAEQPLVGDSLQLVPAGGGPPIVFQANRQANPPVTLPNPYEMTFHPSGKCVFIRGTIYDVPSGKTFDISPATAVVWW